MNRGLLNAKLSSNHSALSGHFMYKTLPFDIYVVNQDAFDDLMHNNVLRRSNEVP